jgi:hypothetical protein
MKLEGVDEFAAGLSKAAQSLDRFGKRATAIGGAVMRAGLALMLLGIIAFVVLLLLF